MDNFKFILFSILVLGLLGFASYWAFSTIESGSTHVDNQKLEDLENQNQKLAKQIADLERANDLLKEEEITPPIVQDPIKEAPVVSTTPTTPTTTYKYQTLINELQKLVDRNIYLKLKSQGVDVGTVQKFLVLYGSSVKVDNDYGATTVTAVKAFQKAEKITADGETGPNTYKKMISWLKTKK